MRTLEYKDICRYFPYKLHVLVNESAIDRDHDDNPCNFTGRVLELRDDNEVLIKDSNGQCFDYWYGDVSPIFRPLSDMYKPIKHNKKEIVPIVECAKMATGLDFKLTEDKLVTFSEDGEYTQQYFGFSQTGSFFHLIDVDDGYESKNEITVNNQYQLFEYLNELKIDYRGLIDAKLGISCYDLPENPYK